jgi:hypothetical protein
MLKDKIQEGDVIFTAIPTFLYRRIAKGTGSPASHVGVLFLDKNKEWTVTESAVPFVRHTPLKKFIDRSDKGWYYIRRLTPALSSNDIKLLKRESDKHMGKLYHFGFKYESKRQFCSKFVFDIYKNALDVEVGQLQTLKELFSRLPNTSLTFWRMWFFGFIPWNRVTVTPASLMNSPNLHTIGGYDD